MLLTLLLNSSKFFKMYIETKKDIFRQTYKWFPSIKYSEAMNDINGMLEAQ